MRLPFTFSDVSFNFRRLRTTAVRKPRTECFCHPVVFIMAAMVAPPGARNMATTRDCFESGLVPLILALTTGFWVAGKAGAAGETASFPLADIAIGISFWLGFGT